jgi:hypothetical protein
MQLELSQLNVRKWWELMINAPQPGEIWLVSTNTEEKIVSRLMLIVSRSEEQDILETLMCTSDLNLTSNKTLLLNPDNTALEFSIGIHLDIFSLLLSEDVFFKKKVGKINDETFKLILKSVNKTNPDALQNFNFGERIIYRSDKRWLNKKNEIALSDIFSSNAMSIIFESIDENWLQLFELNEEFDVESTAFWNDMIDNPAAFDFGNLLSSQNLDIISLSENIKFKDNYLYIDLELEVA